MIVELPVHYEIDARRKRHKSHQKFNVYEWVEFDFPEASADEAPIAVNGIKIGNEETHLRYFNDGLWSPDLVSKQALSADGWAHTSQSIKSTDKPAGFTELCKSGGSESSWANPFDNDEFRDIKASKRETAIAAYRAFVRQNLMMVDEEVYYRRPHEPFFVLEVSYNDVKTPIKYEMIEETNHRHYNPIKADSGIYFRLDRWEDMKSYIETRHPNLANNVEPQPQIIIDNVFSLKDEEISFMRRTKALIAEHKSRMGDYPIEVGTSLYKLRDAFNACSGGIYDTTHEQIDELVPFLRSFLKEMKTAELKTGIQPAAIFKRWEMRPIEFGSAFNF